jgi:NADPH2:quinone reductase
MRQYGGPDVLHFETVPLAALQPDEIGLRSIASAINHSDLEIRAGNWPIRRPQPFPYTPGLEVIGEVVEVGSDVSAFRVGDRAMTMMQGLGGVRAHRPGGYAEYVVVGASAAVTVAADADPLAMAALGLASVTVFVGLQKIGDLANRRIAVTGAAGGVGSAAVAIAKAQGAEVIGIISRAQHAEYVRSLGAVETLTAQDIANGALGSETIDGLLDTVAGKSFAAYVTALRPGGVLSLVGAVGGSDVSFDAFRLVEVTLTGYSTEKVSTARRCRTRLTRYRNG